MSDAALLTPRLVVREGLATDAAFIVELLNDPDFLRFIGDRGVKNEADAVGYLQRLHDGATKTLGLGLRVVEARSTGQAVGLCGLVRRDFLPVPDLGFAFLATHRRHGFGFESSQAVIAEARRRGVARLAAICAPDNVGSRGLLERLGFGFERRWQPPGESAESCLYWLEATRPAEIRARGGPGGG